MDTQVERAKAPQRWGAVRLVAVGATLSIALGLATLVAHEILPSPWDVLGSSIAIWVTAPFLLGRRADSVRLAVPAGFLCLLLVTVTYYEGLRLIYGRGDFVGTMLFWVAAAAILGGPLGLVGFLSGRRSPWGNFWSALPGATFIVEALPASDRFLFYQGDTSAVLWWTWVLVGGLLLLALPRGGLGGRLGTGMGLLVLGAVALMMSWIATHAILAMSSF